MMKKVIIVLIGLLTAIGLKAQSRSAIQGASKIDLSVSVSESLSVLIDQNLSKQQQALEELGALNDQLAFLQQALAQLLANQPSGADSSKHAKFKADVEALEKKIEQLSAKIKKKEAYLNKLKAELKSLQARQSQTAVADQQIVIQSGNAGSYQTIGGANLKVVVSLPGAAPKGGMKVRLKSSNPLVSVPREIIIGGGKTSQEITIRTKAVRSVQKIRIDMDVIEGSKIEQNHFTLTLQKELD